MGLSDLATVGSPSVGAFDLAVQFDPNILSFVDLKFAPYLGDPADPTQTISDISLFENKVVLFGEVFLLTIDDLDGLQASFKDSFLPLAHLIFYGCWARQEPPSVYPRDCRGRRGGSHCSLFRRRQHRGA